ncbi:MAG: hypothetical protein HYZ53_13655 [Planctomycetes bacterium]|nr:hypothetical protein [Planctomycetota bacterium]
MAKCAYCSSRKGNRACPALLGRICSLCCGSHRQREIACPSDCTYLPARGARGELIDRIQTKLLDFALNKDPEAGTAAEIFLGPTRGMETWEQSALGAYVAHGHESSPGERAIDRFERLRGGALSEEERRVLDSFAAAFPGLFEVVDVVRDASLTLRDVLSGVEVQVEERLATHSLRHGARVLAWIMRLDGVTLLTGSLTPVPPAHEEVVEQSLRAAVEAEGAKDPAASSHILVRRALPAVHRALRMAIKEWAPPPVKSVEGFEVGSYTAVYEIVDPGKLRARLAALPGFTQVEPDQFVLLEQSPPKAPGGPEEGEARGDIYAVTSAGPRRVLGRLRLRTVRLTLEATTAEFLAFAKPRLEEALGGLIRHRHDTGESLVERFERDRAEGRVPEAPPDGAGGELELDLGPGGSLEDRHARLLALIERMSPEELAATGLHASGASGASATSDGPDADDGSGGPAEPATRGGRAGRGRGLPPLAHEALYALEPGLEVFVREEALKLRERPGWELRGVSRERLAERRDFMRFLEGHARHEVARGSSPADARRDAVHLAHELFVLLNFEIHRRKTFWVDEELAWALLATELDIQGECLKLPFPSCAFVLADRAALELGESLLSQDRDCPIRNRRLRLLTVYVTAGQGAEGGAQDLHLALFFDAGEGKWPYLIGRDLYVRPQDDLATILDSHAPEVTPAELDPIFLAPELLKLVHLTVNALLYATSAAPERLERPGGGRGGAGNLELVPPRRRGAGDEPYHLPGKIPISQLARFRDLEKTASGRTLMKRFMVRGHWHRAAATWKDQRLRWIEPYWKGPDIGVLIERQYRMKP